MALVGAAASLHVFRSSAEYETASSAFKQYNCMAYGEYDKSKGGSLLKTEYERALNYQPRTSQASRIQRELLESFPASVTLDFDKELPLLPDEVLQAMHDEVWHRWGKELAIVPDTDETVLYNAEQCAYYLRESLQSDGLAGAGWVVEIRQDVIVPMTLPMKKRIYIPKNVLFSASSIRRFLIGHEQKVHAWRAENGDKSGDHVLKAGSPSSMGIEEGLGILSECAIEGSLDNPSFHRARDRYITAGLALGLDGRERDAREVYEIVWRMIALRQSPDGIIDEKSIDQSKQSAYAHIENAFRGTPFWRKGTIYSKLKVYYEELGANASYMMSFNGDLKTALDRAMIGKYNHTSVDERTLFL